VQLRNFFLDCGNWDYGCAEVILSQCVPILHTALARISLTMYSGSCNFIIEKAIAEMTQLIAHDVRHPLSLLRIGLENILNARSLAEAKELASNARVQLNHSFDEVNTLLTEILDAGHDEPESFNDDGSCERDKGKTCHPSICLYQCNSRRFYS